jgi:TatD DNase family protein
MCDFISERDLIKHAHENNVDILLDVAIDGPSCRDVIARAERYDEVYAVIGIHPHDVKNATNADLDFIANNFNHPKVVAIGEIGLDYYRDYSPRDLQKQYFETQLLFAGLYKIPVVIPLSGVFHCFGYSPNEAEICVDMGFHVSFPGALTYEHSKKLKNTAKSIPMKRALIETDSPFITPAKFKKQSRGNLPGYVVETAKALASIRQMELDILQDILFENTMNCFPKLLSALEKR